MKTPQSKNIEINDIKEKKNEIKIKYKNIDNNSKIKIFDSVFVRNNSSNCKIIYNNKKYELSEELNIGKNKEIEIKLLFKNNTSDMEWMFYDCTALISIHGFQNLERLNYITKMERMFYGCSSLISLPDISYLNTSNVTNMSEMFKECSSLQYLGEKLNWNTSKVNEMEYMFDGCSSLKSLPDISKWDVSKVTSMFFQNGMYLKLNLCGLCFMVVHHYYHYLIFQNGI